MTAQTRAVNKGRFEQGDTPQGSDYADVIDSYLSIADTSAQSISSDLTVPALVATSVNATRMVTTFAAGEGFNTTTASVAASTGGFSDLGLALTVVGDVTSEFGVTADSLQYTGSETRTFLVSTDFSIRASAAGRALNVRFAVNGSAQPRTDTFVGLGTTEVAVHKQSLIRLAENDRVNVMIQAATAAGGYQVKNLQLVARQ